MILELRNKIKDEIEKGFKELNLRPFVTITAFPDSEKALEELSKTAQSRQQPGGAIFITWSAEHPGPLTGRIYGNFVDYFTIFIFSNDKSGDVEIIKQYEAVRNILNKSFYLYRGEMAPVKTGKEGLYMAYLQVGIRNIYQGE
jgi:hypothetical protein